QEQNAGSMDRYLDGVQEVAYIHSNQNVVGSSKAENRLSRWAVRDVFELKQFSQLPANIAVCSAKRNNGMLCSKTWINGKPLFMLLQCGVNERTKHAVSLGKKPCPLYLQCRFKFKNVNAFFFIDNYRRQFEEMASHFNMGSVEELAEYVVKATSETRQKMLKEFYVSKHPELDSFFSVEILAQASHDCEESELGTTFSRKRKSVRRSESRSSLAKGILLNGATEMQSYKEVKQLHDDYCTQDMCVDAKCKLSSTVATQHIGRRNSQAFKDFMASGSLSNKSEIIEVLSLKSCEGQQDSRETQLPRKRSLSQSENGERKAQGCKKKSFEDILGDTSILNDLFKNDGNGSTESPRQFTSGHVEKSKERPKDFWDMLNEQNEESLRKLTDVAVIEKLCERAPHQPMTEEKEVCESSLWKENENFLWKKY
ncbi:DNA excision repair protein ERCC-6-like 2, partial [Cuculus canorus]